MKYTPYKLMLLIALTVSLYACKKNEATELKLTSPANNSIIDIDKMDFSWQGASNKGYVIQISTNNSFTDLTDSVQTDSLHFHTALIEPSYYDTPNYVMGQTYYWQVTSLSNPPSRSEIHQFTISDPRSNFTGQWNGTWHHTAWYPINIDSTYIDTTYASSITLYSNEDGSLSLAPDSVKLFPKDNFHFSTGSSNNGAGCYLDNSLQKITYMSGRYGFGGGVSYNFTGTR